MIFLGLDYLVRVTRKLRNVSSLNLLFGHGVTYPTPRRKTALQQLIRQGWLGAHSYEALRSIRYLNHNYMRRLPGKHLHSVVPERNRSGSLGEDYKEQNAAFKDFKQVFVGGEPGEMVLRMLSVFAQSHIDGYSLRRAKETEDGTEIQQFVEAAFKKFDRLASVLNHIFDQFCVNVLVTRAGFVPRQDPKIESEIYQPTLNLLSDPKWKSLSADLADMFSDYQAQNYSEVITKAHSVLQRFLQILVGEEGKGGKGEVGKLFSRAKERRCHLGQPL